MDKIKGYIIDFLYLIFPHVCAGCGRKLHTNEGCICVHCLYSLPETDFETDPSNPIAKSFWGRVPLQYASAFYNFTKGGIVQALIHQLKYKGRQDVGLQLGFIYGGKIKKTFTKVDLIIPIPLHPKKIKQRGYNQAECFAKGISKVINVPLNNTAVTRAKDTRTQTKLNRLDRWNNVNDIFKVAHQCELIGKHILLVDDVITTGATLDACATELLKVPGIKISIAAIAYAEM